ncbi:MAG: hypothetical protein IJ485_05830 [Lachnospiraceae bacterium]|nr:hypothetical protein [Lachnospiraceae bacterium]
MRKTNEVISLKEILNMKLWLVYFSGLTVYFHSDGTLKMLYLALPSGEKIEIPYICLIEYTPFMVEEIMYHDLVS